MGRFGNGVLYEGWNCFPNPQEVAAENRARQLRAEPWVDERPPVDGLAELRAGLGRVRAGLTEIRILLKQFEIRELRDELEQQKKRTKCAAALGLVLGVIIGGAAGRGIMSRK